MSTQLQDKGKYFLVSTIASPGRRRHIPRGAVVVVKGDKDKLIAEIVRQADRARAMVGVPVE